MSDLIKDFVLFTPALLVVKGGITHDPVEEFNGLFSVPGDERPQVLLSPYPFFTGLGHSVIGGSLYPWDHQLYACPNKQWDKLQAFLNNMAFVNSVTGQFARVLAYAMMMVDPVALHAKVARIVQVGVTVFGISAFDGEYYIAPAKQLPHDRPALAIRPPNPETVRYGKVIVSLTQG